MEYIKNLVQSLKLERERIYKNRHVPIDELQQLAFVSYSCSEISIDKACEMLCINYLEFRELWNLWIKDNPRMKRIFDEGL